MTAPIAAPAPCNTPPQRDDPQQLALAEFTAAAIAVKDAAGVHAKAQERYMAAIKKLSELAIGGDAPGDLR